MKKGNIFTCRICKSDNTEQIRIGKTILIGCSDCDVYFLKDLPTKEQLDIYYRENYKISGHDYIQTERRRVSRIPEQVILISRIMEYKKPPAKILDIGCDKGFFLDEARRYGFDVSGVEPSVQSRRYCERTGISVKDRIDKIDEKFDIIVMWHSLEHHIDPLETLCEIKKLLNPGGLIFIRVPAFNCLWRKIFRSRWIWFQSANHYFHFTPGSLRKALDIAGLRILKLEQRKPNDKFTKKLDKQINSNFKFAFGVKVGFKDYLISKYENLTGVELFAIARLESPEIDS
jgi:SAM-dependent methyltransferase